MCQPASFVVTENRVYWSCNTEGHEEIIAEHNIRDAIAERINIVRCEVSPPDGALALPVEEWVYRLDQDITPDWYDAEEVERRCREALSAWRAAKLHVDGDARVRNGLHYVCGCATVRASDSATVRAYDSATVRAYGSATVEASGRATVMRWSIASRVTLAGQCAVLVERTQAMPVCYVGGAALAAAAEEAEGGE